MGERRAQGVSERERGLALISHAISDVFDVQGGMQGGKSLN